ncbi:MAG TPA: LuxR C-terminal-related transcriptional regulator [Gaiellaceae bacterium]|nr:LuxR C-terminal-related transcriptional regulator [Gaiellaceae bacterium]
MAKHELTSVLCKLGAGIDELEDLPMPVYVIDKTGTEVWHNKAAVELFGEVLPRPFTDFVAPDYRAAAKDAFTKKMLGTQKASAYELEVLDKNGHRRKAEIASVLLSGGGHGVGVFGVVDVQARPPAPQLPGAKLTPRQFEVLRHLAAGRMTSEIADLMGVSRETVRNHVRGLLRALRVHSRLEAVIEARRLKLID